MAAVVFAEFVADEGQAQAGGRRFEPTDLNMKGGAGASEISLQSGVVAGGDIVEGGGDGVRVSAPDVEAIFGLSTFAQVQIDATLGADEDYGSKYRFLENTWTSLKLGIFDDSDPINQSAWAAGVQVGPKLPTTVAARGLGFEAIGIVGRTVRRVHLFAQAGVLLDPFYAPPDAPRFRPFAIEGGFDLDVDLDAQSLWSLKAELGGARFITPSGALLHLTGGIAYQIAAWLELSVIGIAGLGPGDRFGVLAGASPRFNLL